MATIMKDLIPSPPDARDYQFQPTIAPATLAAIRKIDLLTFLPPVVDQLSEDSCVDNGLPKSIESVTIRWGTHEFLSRQFPYFVVRDQEGRIGEGGTWARDALEVGRKVGFCLDSEWGYSPSMQDVRPPQSAYDSALTRLIGRYESVPLYPDDAGASIASIKAAIAEADAGLCTPPMFVMKIGQKYRELLGPMSTQNYISFTSGLPGTEYIGLHLQYFRGHDDDLNLGSFMVRGSWGEQFGDMGDVAIPYGCVADFTEVWVVRKYKGIDMSDQALAARRTQIAQLYAALFGRAPERYGLAYWAGRIAAGESAASVAQAMFNCDPARAYYPSGITNSALIDSFYRNVLGRPADAGGLAYWSGQLDSGRTPGDVIATIIGAVVGYVGSDPEALMSQRLFSNKTTVGMYCAVDLSCNNVTIASAALSRVTDDPESADTARKSIRDLIGGAML